MDYISKMEYQQSMMNLEEEAEQIGDIEEEELRKDELIQDIDKYFKKFIVEG